MFHIRFFDRFAQKWIGYAALPLRIALGIIFIYHGYIKLFGGLDGFSGAIASFGLPAPYFLAVVVGLVEFLGGISLLIGFFTRWSAVLIGIDMIFAFFLVRL